MSQSKRSKEPEAQIKWWSTFILLWSVLYLINCEGNMSFQGPQPRLIKKNQRNPELLSMLSSKLLKNCFYSDNYAFLSLFLFFFSYYLRLRSPSRQQTNRNHFGSAHHLSRSSRESKTNLILKMFQVRFIWFM